MSIRKTIDYIYEMELGDLIDVIHSPDFKIELYLNDNYIAAYDNPRWNIPIMYFSMVISQIEMGNGGLIVYLKD